MGLPFEPHKKEGTQVRGRSGLVRANDEVDMGPNMIH